MDRNKNKTDYSIVEQKIEPSDVFTNLSECDLREVKYGLGPECNKCKMKEKRYFEAENRYLKMQEQASRYKLQLARQLSEASVSNDNASLLP